MIKMLNPSLTSIEKKYLVLSDFWCRMNNIRVKSVECIPLEDGSCDSKLIDRCDLKNRIIYIKDYEESVMSMVNMIIKFIFNDINKTLNEEIINVANENAQIILYSSENEPNVKGDEEIGTDKLFEFITWMKKCAYNEKVENWNFEGTIIWVNSNRRKEKLTLVEKDLRLENEKIWKIYK